MSDSPRLEPFVGFEALERLREKVKEVSLRTYGVICEWVGAGKVDPESGLNLRDALRYLVFEEMNGPAGEEIARGARLPD